MALQDWDKLRIFYAVAEAGSFTHAAERLGISQSAVSRQISALEASLNLKLFIRHARGLVLTETGEQLFATVRVMNSELKAVENQITESRDVPAGPLVVTTTVGIGSTWLSPRIYDFIALYPTVQLEIRLTDTDLDLAMREADVAIRLHQPSQSEMIQRKLFTVHFHVYASRSYLAQNTPPTSVKDLDKHCLITFGTPVPSHLADINYLEKTGRPDNNPRIPTLRVNSISGMTKAVRAGVGIAMLPDYAVEGDTELVSLLPDLKLPEFDSYFVYPPALKNSKRIAVFRDFLVGSARNWKF